MDRLDQGGDSLNHKLLLDSVKHLELARIMAYKMLAEEMALNGEVPLGTRLPRCQIERLVFKDFEATKLTYEGRLPMYIEDRKYKQEIRDYYIGATVQAVRGYSFKKLDNAVIIIRHYFNDSIVKDLDNRNRSYLINAIRYAGLIKDDSWKEIKLMEEGYFIEGQEKVEVFVFEQANLIPFLQESVSKPNSKNGQHLCVKT